VARILVVDDDGLILKGVAKVLAKAGHDVLTAVDVQSALRHASSGPVDAALVDYALQHETGLGVLAHLKDIQPRCIRILVTGVSDSAAIVEAVNGGEVAKVIKKPFDGALLLRELGDAFRSAQRMWNLRHQGQLDGDEADGHALDQALHQSLGMALQPIFDLRSGTPTVFAYEALLRPKHERLRNPMDLLNTAERHDRIHEVGSVVFALAGRILAKLPPDVRLFVNLHPVQLESPEGVARDLQAFGAHAGRVTLEITEHSSFSRLDRWAESVQVISDAGCTLAVDDLGSGYNSLAVLAELQPDFLKLDMSLVRNVHLEPRKQKLCELLCRFGNATGAVVIGEGVETEEEMCALADIGVQLMQGYHFARPSEKFVDLGQEGGRSRQS
jgi:EAL domain-containing protein (putative c-di-GMP-specific phosphodiesterase class I)/ActR/RegA family two-component response regulator